MQQIGIDISSFPEVYSFKHLVIGIDYFNKWSEAKTIKIKVPPPLPSSFMRLHVSIDVRRFRLMTKGESLFMKLAKFYTS